MRRGPDRGARVAACRTRSAGRHVRPPSPKTCSQKAPYAHRNVTERFCELMAYEFTTRRFQGFLWLSGRVGVLTPMTCSLHSPARLTWQSLAAGVC